MMLIPAGDTVSNFHSQHGPAEPLEANSPRGSGYIKAVGGKAGDKTANTLVHPDEEEEQDLTITLKKNFDRAGNFKKD